MRFTLLKSSLSKLSLLLLTLLALLLARVLSAEDTAPNDPSAQEQSDLTQLPQPAPERDETLRNQAVAAQLALTDKDTEVTWLGTGKDQFLSLYLADNSGEPFVNALILHDNLQNPDWPGAVRTLRRELTKGGWNTLSIAVPDYRPRPRIPPLEPTEANAASAELDTEATEPPDPEAAGTDSSAANDPAQAAPDPQQLPEELVQRMQLASRFLQEKTAFPLVVIGVGSSATLLLEQARAGNLGDVNGLVIIDPLPLPELGATADLGEDAADIRLPLLDIAPEFNPRSNPKTRADAARRQHQTGYQQRIIRGSYREFKGAEPGLIKAIRGWGEKLYRRR
ncbi:DUF3530 family protein [Ketobacter sp.]|uniref:DUF3530 family protein n=1 Tax=Ketobacter sp. TaxID=2083498 RepID=UPI000F22DBF8|nr:DUF3530 family protein [Ketobacter sp.]RLT94799.1 MAG: DUF3530 family protein [Ketobacter sp.]